MKKAPIIMLIILLALVSAGCTATNTTDPIVGTWRDQELGAAQLEFLNNNTFYLSILDSAFDGNWSRIDTTHYSANYTDINNSSASYSIVIDYDSTNKVIYMDSKPTILYSKIMDKILGNWTDQSQTSLMQFRENHSWMFATNNSNYNGNWTKINGTSYYVDYSDGSNNTSVYRELIFYNLSDCSMRLDNIPYMHYTRIS